MGRRIVAVVGLVAALLGIAVAGVSAATAEAPVVKESFTPLPCRHNSTTLGEEGCAERSILASDQQIDTLNARIFKQLNAAGRRDFIAGHNAWFKYRQVYCLSESDIYQGGTEAGIVQAQCAADVNAAHVGQLKNFLSSLPRG